MSAAVNTVGKSNSDRIPSLADVRKPPITHHPCVCVVELGGAMVTFSTFGPAIPSHIRIATMEYPSYSIPRHPRCLSPNPHPPSPSSTPVPIALVLTSLPNPSLYSLDLSVPKPHNPTENPFTAFIFVPYHHPETRDIFPSSTHRPQSVEPLHSLRLR